MKILSKIKGGISKYPSLEVTEDLLYFTSKENIMDFKRFVESYRCRICKIQLDLDNFGYIYENHGICCKDCYKKYF